MTCVSGLASHVTPTKVGIHKHRPLEYWLAGLTAEFWTAEEGRLLFSGDPRKCHGRRNKVTHRSAYATWFFESEEQPHVKEVNGGSAFPLAGDRGDFGASGGRPLAVLIHDVQHRAAGACPTDDREQCRNFAVRNQARSDIAAQDLSGRAQRRLRRLGAGLALRGRPRGSGVTRRPEAAPMRRWKAGLPNAQPPLTAACSASGKPLARGARNRSR
jgi:hypothetical protein